MKTLFQRIRLVSCKPTTILLCALIVLSTGAVAIVWAGAGFPGETPNPLPDQPMVAFTAAQSYVGEGAGVVVLTVKLSAASTSTVTVQYATADGTAKAPSDYVSASDTLIFAPGVTEKQITITIVNDTVAEPTESFSVVLSNPQNAGLGAISTATVTIIDDDGPPPTVQFASASYSVAENAGTAVIAVTLSAAAPTTVTVNYQTSDGPAPDGATAGSDYDASSGVLTFAVGETSKTFAIPIINDTAPEPNETISLQLSGPTGATLGTPSTATLTITDDDAPPPVVPVTVIATGATFSPDPTPINTWADAPLSAKAVRPTPSSGTLSAPSWSWVLVSAQYSEVSDQGPWT